MRSYLDLTLRQARRIAVIVVGFTVLLVGVAMTVLPGPAIVVIPAGLAILATELVWARELLRRIREQAERARERFRPARPSAVVVETSPGDPSAPSK